MTQNQVNISLTSIKQKLIFKRTFYSNVERYNVRFSLQWRVQYQRRVDFIDISPTFITVELFSSFQRSQKSAAMPSTKKGVSTLVVMHVAIKHIGLGYAPGTGPGNGKTVSERVSAWNLIQKDR